MQWEHPACRLGVFGMSGSGKTHFALRFLRGSRARCVFLFDPEGEFSHKLGIPLASTVPGLVAGVQSGWCAFDPWEMFDDGEAAIGFFSDFAMEVSGRIPGRKLFVVDELQEFVTGHQVPPALRRLVWRGRRRGLDSVFIAQAPNQLHNLIRGQLTQVVLFQLTDNCNLEFPEQFGFQPEQVKALREREWIWRNKRGEEQRGGPYGGTGKRSQGTVAGSARIKQRETRKRNEP